MNNNIINYDESYERIKKRIEEINKHIKYIYIQDPRGDKNKTNPIAFSIGKVKTVDPSTKAEVKNVGTNENVILDFKIPKGDKGEQGEKGISETIVIDATQTIEATEEASVIDDFKDNTHHLTFNIPKGEKGEVGPGAGSTAHNAILSIRYADATDSRALTIKEKTFIPEPTTIFTIPSTINIDINVTGIYEITLCGKITGVTEDNGASFYLWNTTTGTVINNLTFSLLEGTTSTMNFAGITITQIFAPATLQVKTNITNDTTLSNIKFTDINLIIKR